ncbi:GNAT family N-acetyltransferase [Clostridium sp. DJ247]|uniref:GNAT family N-acetyltransferase n=1 Tax=Clostridium sp. DJ247 TaxID=2726188 RepID=UPI001629635A|nr:GNAT family protein [Clostridium sp. DJ247]MBC2581832.1 GNAT family N-acetyltransferase [Clostridium sp. DJ247]
MLINRLLTGTHIRLCSFKDDDLYIFESWYNNTEFLRLYDVVPAFPKSQDQLKEMLHNIKKSNDKYIFAVRSIKDNTLVGVTGFENILWNNGTAIVYIGIGDIDSRGKGIGNEALYLTMEFGFQELNLHRIQLTVLSYNKPAISLYEKLGFKREGTYREYIHRDGKRYDMYLYGILRQEWEDMHKNNL